MLVVDQLDSNSRLRWKDKKKPTTAATSWYFSLRVDMMLMPLSKKVTEATYTAYDAAAWLKGQIQYSTKTAGSSRRVWTG